MTLETVALIVCSAWVIVKLINGYFDNAHEDRDHQYRMAFLERGIEDDPDTEEDEALLDPIEEALL